MKYEFCVIIRISFSEADVIVGGRCHMLRAKELHSHATPSRYDVKIALLFPLPKLQRVKVCDNLEKT